MRVSCAWLYVITRYGYPPSFTDMLRAYRDISTMGFQYAELEAVGRGNLEDLLRNRQRLITVIRDEGLSIINMVPVFPDLVSMDQNRRKAALDLFRRAAELAASLGCRTLQLDSYFPPLRTRNGVPYKDTIEFGSVVHVEYDKTFQWPVFWKVLVDTVARCTEVAAEFGMRLCIEPRVAETISNTDAMLRLIDHVSSPNLGMVFDAAHLHAAKEILPLSIMKAADRIFYVHVADNDSTQNYHQEIGHGTIDWPVFFQALVGVGYEGYVGIDVGNVPNIETAVRRSKVAVETMLRELGSLGQG